VPASRAGAWREPRFVIAFCGSAGEARSVVHRRRRFAARNYAGAVVDDADDPLRRVEIGGLPGLFVERGEWEPWYADIIDREGLTALSIRVWRDDLTFLDQLPQLRGLVLNAWEVRDLSIVERLAELEYLVLNTPRRPRLPLNFSAFLRLRSLSVIWNPGFESLFSCRGLETLTVSSPPDGDLERFGDFAALRRLYLYEGRRLKNTCQGRLKSAPLAPVEKCATRAGIAPAFCGASRRRAE
jgi:hypothetical protein